MFPLLLNSAVGPISGALSTTESADSASAMGTLSVQGSVHRAEFDDIPQASGALAIRAFSGTSEAYETLLATSVLFIGGAVDAVEMADMLAVVSVIAIVATLSIPEADDTGSADTFMGGIPLPARPGGGEDSAWERYARERQWQADLRRIIEQAWRIAHGEIDSVTRDVKPPPDLRVILGVLSRRAEARVNEDLRSYVTRRQRCAEDDATAVLLLAA